jgi:hypothetical protein
MTLALAIFGAVTGGIGALLDVLQYTFDRPRLVVGFRTSRSVDDPAVIGIDVTNRGRRPTTILKAAYRPDTGLRFLILTAGLSLNQGQST